MAKNDSLEAIVPFLEPILQSVGPRERKGLMTRLLRYVRRVNAKRIRTNVEPEGGKMSARKPRPGPKRGKMFRRIGKQNSLKFRVSTDEGELRFANALIEHTAAEHHFGLVGFVGKTRKGKTIKARYNARKLLGFGSEQAELVDQVLAHLSGD